MGVKLEGLEQGNMEDRGIEAWQREVRGCSGPWEWCGLNSKYYKAPLEVFNMHIDLYSNCSVKAYCYRY